LPPSCRGRAVKLRAARSGRCRGGWQAALTKPGRIGTARRCGFGKRDEKPYERNQCLKPRNTCTGSNLADMGRGAVHATELLVATPKLVKSAGGEAMAKACGVVVARLPGYSWAAHSTIGWW
jgi:hypothetical protein